MIGVDSHAIIEFAECDFSSPIPSEPGSMWEAWQDPMAGNERNQEFYISYT